MEKRSYDILTIAYVILVIASMIILSKVFSNAMSPITSDPSTNFTEDFNKAVQDVQRSSLIGRIVIGSIMFIYWIFILLLAIKLKVSVVSLILIIIFVPFAVFYYLFSLRKLIPSSNSQVQQTNISASDSSAQ